MHACRKEDALTRTISIDYHLFGIPVCGSVFAGAYGISASTFDQITSKVLAGKHAWRDVSPKTRAPGPSDLYVAATTWWLQLFLCFDCTTKKGKIMYDVRNWNITYADEFIPTMHALGHMWREPTLITPDDAVGCSDEGAIDDTDSVGSRGMWYRARNEALQRFADTEYYKGSQPFELISRRKLCAHASPCTDARGACTPGSVVARRSAYKECCDCKENRVGKSCAISNGESYAVVHSWTVKQQVHMRWVYDQRYALEAWRQAATRDNGVLYEQADKCGDGCLYLPGGGRVSSANQGKWKFRVALQANLYPGKALNVFMLLPSLKTGANFGATTWLHSLVNMVNCGSLTKETHTIVRGSDGGSEFVAFTIHATHCHTAQILGKRIIWARYAPDHSHDLADRFFSWVEGFLNDLSHHGCMTIWEQLDLIRAKHKTSAYANTLLSPEP